MLLNELKTEILKDNLKQFYVFTGTEYGLMRFYARAISNKLHNQELSIETAMSICYPSDVIVLRDLDEIPDILCSKSLLLDERKVYLLLEEDETQFVSYFQEGGSPVFGDCFILVKNSVDKRKLAYKANLDHFVDFKPMDSTHLEQHTKVLIDWLTDEQIYRVASSSKTLLQLGAKCIQLNDVRNFFLETSNSTTHGEYLVNEFVQDFIVSCCKTDFEKIDSEEELINRFFEKSINWNQINWNQINGIKFLSFIYTKIFNQICIRGRPKIFDGGHSKLKDPYTLGLPNFVVSQVLKEPKNFTVPQLVDMLPIVLKYLRCKHYYYWADDLVVKCCLLELMNCGN